MGGLNYWGALGRKHRLELSRVSPELNKKENGPKSLAKGLLLDFVQRGVILTLVEVKSFIRKPYIQ